MKVKIVGIMRNEKPNTETGEMRKSTILHYITLKPIESTRYGKSEGVAAENFWTNIDTSKIILGKTYDLEFDVVKFGNNPAEKRLVGISEIA